MSQRSRPWIACEGASTKLTPHEADRTGQAFVRFGCVLLMRELQFLPTPDTEPLYTEQRQTGTGAQACALSAPFKCIQTTIYLYISVGQRVRAAVLMFAVYSFPTRRPLTHPQAVVSAGSQAAALLAATFPNTSPDTVPRTSSCPGQRALAQVPIRCLAPKAHRTQCCRRGQRCVPRGNADPHCVLSFQRPLRFLLATGPPLQFGVQVWSAPVHRYLVQLYTACVRARAYVWT